MSTFLALFRRHRNVACFKSGIIISSFSLFSILTSGVDAAVYRSKLLYAGTLNTFDLANACQYFSTTHKRVGPSVKYDGYLDGDNKFHAIFLLQGVFAEEDDQHRLQSCGLKSYVTELSKSNISNSRALSVDEYDSLYDAIGSYQKNSTRRTKAYDFYSDTQFAVTLAPTNYDNEFNGCPFALRWVNIGNTSYALLSIPTRSPDIKLVSSMDRVAFDCSSWKALDGSRFFLVSHDLQNLGRITKPDGDHYILASRSYPLGVYLTPDENFACFEGNDAFQRHIIIEKSSFDHEFREPLKNIITLSLGTEPIGNPREYVMKLKDALIKQAAWLMDYSDKKGCSVTR